MVVAAKDVAVFERGFADERYWCCSRFRLSTDVDMHLAIHRCGMVVIAQASTIRLLPLYAGVFAILTLILTELVNYLVKKRSPLVA